MTLQPTCPQNCMFWGKGNDFKAKWFWILKKNLPIYVHTLLTYILCACLELRMLDIDSREKYWIEIVQGRTSR